MKAINQLINHWVNRTNFYRAIYPDQFSPNLGGGFWMTYHQKTGALKSENAGQDIAGQILVGSAQNFALGEISRT